MKHLVSVVVVVAFFVLPLRAQTEAPITGVITGLVVDAVTREPLPGANVLLVGTTIGAASDGSGEFRIDAVPVGSYSVRVSVIGYQSIIKSDVIVSTGRPQRLD
ncbi:MAG: carboxypeptidase-like regulatory domain-containing protein, partial [Proteobacteria bacterium]|nr:carboxypeptidase-like regulatory domain-containing protein [Pseudomonadota bacterium]